MKKILIQGVNYVKVANIRCFQLLTIQNADQTKKIKTLEQVTYQL